VFRQCHFITSVVGAEYADGAYIDWYYEGDNLAPQQPTPIGRVDGTIFDTADDGSCAWLSLRHIDSHGNLTKTKNYKACGKGAKNVINDSDDLFNTAGTTGHYVAGTWKAFLWTLLRRPGRHSSA
jgi:hypothetical protein